MTRAPARRSATRPSSAAASRAEKLCGNSESVTYVHSSATHCSRPWAQRAFAVGFIDAVRTRLLERRGIQVIAAYHMLCGAVDYKDLGTAFPDQASTAAVKRGLVKRLERLGYAVSLQRIEPQAEA